MSDFKLLAIRPLEDCNKKYYKTLNQGEIYWFISDYKFQDDKITYKSSLPEKFYNINPQIQLSAIVGKNGSGKSSIIELLMMTINNLAKYFSEKENPNGEMVLNKPLYWANEGESELLSVELYFKTKKIHVIKIWQLNIEIFDFEENGNVFTRNDKNIIENFKLEEFFYSIVVNYSHYGLDADFLGKWLTELFHKNDGYQVPIVINPFREEGSINVKREHSLVKARLLTNIVSGSFDSNNALTDNQEINGISLKPTNVLFSTKKLYSEASPANNGLTFWSAFVDISITDLRINDDEILTELNSVFDFKYNDLDKVKFKNSLDYLVYKLVRICVNYKKFEKYFSVDDKVFKKELLKEYLVKVCENEDSHITYKIRQTLNYLKYQHFELEDKVLQVEELTSDINKVLTSNNIPEVKRIEFIPPPVFDVEYLLAPISSAVASQSLSSFDLLSSGEKQMVYSLNSIYYHLRNLNSVANDLIQYKNYCIIFEEIELYFHPDYQRKYISELLKGVNRLGLKEDVSIHFCFLTHSPFILSDIPKSNILRLDKGKSKPFENNEQTFGANIHLLLRDSFFMEGGLIGEFAKKEIQKIIDWIKIRECEQKNPSTDELSYQLLKNTIKDFNLVEKMSDEDIKIRIELIGEPIVKKSLIERYIHLQKDNSWIQKMIDDLEKLKA